MCGFFGEVGKVFKPVVRIAAPIVGAGLGGPLGAAAASAAATAATGGNRGDIFRSGALGGLGAAAGSAFGSQNYLARYLGGSDVFQTATTGVGAYLGNNAAASINANLRAMRQANAEYTAPSAPSFEVLKAEGAAKAREAFEREGIRHILADSLHRRIRRSSEIDIYNYTKFADWKSRVKSRSRKGYRSE